MTDREKVISTLEEIKTQTAEIGLDSAVIGMNDMAFTISRILENKIAMAENNGNNALIVTLEVLKEIIAVLKDQEERLAIVLEGQKEIKLHKKHVITWKRDDEFTTRKLYEAVCETLMDEGELVITRIDDHEKVDFTFYVTHEVT